jgi:hypothetical protein
MAYWVYEYVLVEGKRASVQAVVHQADCRAYNHGKGYSYNAGTKRNLLKWHGPFKTVNAAKKFAAGLTGKALSCKRCAPF